MDTYFSIEGTDFDFGRCILKDQAHIGWSIKVTTHFHLV